MAPLGPAGGEAGRNYQNINVHCIDFPEEETNTFYAGSEDYNIYQANLHQSSRSVPNQASSGQNIVQTYSGHFAPVTRVCMHPGVSQSEKIKDVSDLMLTSSIDWTIKLWYPKIRADALYTFESAQEYVYDVQWSPVHPSVFASCDGDGYVDIWDINKDMESPQVHKRVANKTLNVLRWSNDGRRMAVGDADGFLSLYSVDKEFYSQKGEDFAKMERLIRAN